MKTLIFRNDEKTYSEINHRCAKQFQYITTVYSRQKYFCRKISVMASVVFLAAIFVGCGASQKIMMNTGQHPNEFKTTLVKQVDIPYLVYLPKEYETKGKMPLLFFLHGSGERGNDPQKLKVHSIPKIIDDRDDFPFIVVSPQCPDGQRWDVEVLNALLDKVIAELPVDSNRIYLTGLSMGGYGVWRFAIAHPDRFAAIAPVCGWGVLEDVEKLRTMPVWVFHGAKDNVVPPSESEKMVERLQKFGNTQVKFTLYPDANHNAWDAAYGTPELYEWFLQHTKKSF